MIHRPFARLAALPIVAGLMLLAPTSASARGAPDSFADLAQKLGIATTDVTNRLAWARRKLREVLLDLLRECTGSESELRDEARALLGLDGP